MSTQDDYLRIYNEQKSQLTNKEFYDPEQSTEKKRTIRQSYRTLIKETEGKKVDILEKSIHDLDTNLIKANSIFKDVLNPQEAMLDSQMLVLAADLSVQKAQRLRIQVNRIETHDVVSRIRQKMASLSHGGLGVAGSGRGGGEYSELESDDDERDSLNPNNVNWTRFARLVQTHTLGVPSLGIAYGPIMAEYKKRTVHRAKATDNKHNIIQPTQLSEKDLQQKENETTRNVTAIGRLLESVGRIPMLQFIINPKSFGQSVENLFYLSFLIKDGIATIEEDEDNHEIWLERCQPPSEEDYAQGLVKKQLMVNFDEESWETCIKLYNIKESIIPNRNVNSEIQSETEWYG